MVVHWSLAHRILEVSSETDKAWVTVQTSSKLKALIRLKCLDGNGQQTFPSPWPHKRTLTTLGSRLRRDGFGQLHAVHSFTHTRIVQRTRSVICRRV